MRLELNFLHSKVGRRVIGLFLLSALAPIIVTAIVSFTYITDLLVQNSQTELRRSGKFYGMSILDRIRVVEDRLQNLSIVLSPEKLNSKEINTRFENELKTIVLVTNKGKLQVLLGDKNNLPPLPDITSSSKKAKIFNNNLYDSFPPVYIDVIVDSGPLMGASLIAEFNRNYLWGDIAMLPYATNMCVIEDGKLTLYCSHSVTSALQVQLNNFTDSTIPAHFDWTAGDKKYLAASWGLFMKPLYRSSNWTIIASQPESEALVAISTFYLLFPLVIIVALLITSFLSISQIRRSLIPLEKLIDATRRVANKEFGNLVKINSGDEFEELATSFNNMTEQLGKQFNALITLSEIDQLILSNPELDKVVLTILKRIQGIAPCDVVCITIIDQHNAHSAQCYISQQDNSEQINIERSSLDIDDIKMLANSHGNFELNISHITETFLSPLASRGAKYVSVFPIKLEHDVAAIITLGYQNQQTSKNTDFSQICDLTDRLAVAIATAKRDEKLYLQAHYDSLTGLPNRELFNDRLEQEIIHAQLEKHKVALLFIDLDRFKSVNDTMGHTVGDQLLQKIATRLKFCVRETDTVARLGGDEFTIIISNVTEPKDASIIADHVISAISKPLRINNQEIFINSSIGISVYPSDGDNGETLLKNADAAMYRAKENGRGRYQFFEEQMNAEDVERTNMERDLRYALEREEFEIHFQPQINLHNGKIVGAEALLRWNQPQRGLLLPDVFIPLAEDTGLIESIGKWVLKTTCLQYMEWKNQNINLHRIAVNVSSRQFLQKDFVAQISKILLETAMPANNLELEITESLLMNNNENTVIILNQLSDMGIHLSIDDFGTGYSSLSYLKRLPVDTLKIDQSFMDGIPLDDDAIAITSSIIALAHTLNKKVIAEGIETIEQLTLLRNRMCDIGQGYFFNVPLNTSDFEQYVQAKSSYLKVIN